MVVKNSAAGTSRTFFLFIKKVYYGKGVFCLFSKYKKPQKKMNLEKGNKTIKVIFF